MFNFSESCKELASTPKHWFKVKLELEELVVGCHQERLVVVPAFLVVSVAIDFCFLKFLL